MEPERRGRLALYAGTVSAYADMYLTQPVLPDLSREFGVGPARAGLTVSAVVLAIAAASSFYGPLSDALGRKRVMVGASALRAVATLHGVLQPSGEPAKKGVIQTRSILVQTGGKDPMVKKDQVQALEKEMKAAGVKVKVITYPQAKHGFTNPDADTSGMEGLAYDAKVDKASWAALVKYLKTAL